MRLNGIETGMPVVWTILALSAAYAGIGVAVALRFVTWSVGRVDEAASTSGWGFRVMILPGCVGLWPVVLAKSLAGRGG